MQCPALNELRTNMSDELIRIEIDDDNTVLGKQDIVFEVLIGHQPSDHDIEEIKDICLNTTTHE